MFRVHPSISKQKGISTNLTVIGASGCRRTRLFLKENGARVSQTRRSARTVRWAVGSKSLASRFEWHTRSVNVDLFAPGVIGFLEGCTLISYQKCQMLQHIMNCFRMRAIFRSCKTVIWSLITNRCGRKRARYRPLDRSQRRIALI